MASFCGSLFLRLLSANALHTTRSDIHPEQSSMATSWPRGFFAFPNIPDNIWTYATKVVVAKTKFCGIVRLCLSFKQCILTFFLRIISQSHALIVRYYNIVSLVLTFSVRISCLVTYCIIRDSSYCMWKVPSATVMHLLAYYLVSLMWA